MASSSTGAEQAPAAVSLGEATRFWLKLGCVNFGGPAGQIALMHEELVTRRRWIGEERFLHALNYCMLLPGPEATQLATYVGWLLHRVPGGLIAGGLFVLPGAPVMFALAWVYAAFETPASLSPGTRYWMVLKGVKGTARLGLELGVRRARYGRGAASRGALR